MNADIVINEEVYKNFFGFGLTLTNNSGIYLKLKLLVQAK